MLTFEDWKDTLTDNGKKYFIATMVAIVVIGGVYYWRQGSAVDAAAPITATVTRSTVKATVKVVGKAVLANEQKMRFNQVGKVAVVTVKAGDHVKKDQLIAKLDETDAQNAIRQSETSLANARLTLQDLQNGSTKSAILSSRNTVADTKNKITVSENNLAIAKQNEAATLSDLDRQMQLAKDDAVNKQTILDLAKKDLNQFTQATTTTTTGGSPNSYAETVSGGIIKGRTALTSIGTALTTLNGVLGVDSGTETINDAFEINLGALNSSTLSAAQNSFRTARAKEKEANTLYTSLNLAGGATSTDVMTYLIGAQAALSLSVGAAEDTYTMLYNTVSSANFVQSSLDSYRSSVASQRSTLQGQLTTINATLAEIRTLDDPRSKQSAYDTAAYNLAQSQKTLQNLVDTLSAKKSTATLTRMSAENELKALRNTLAQVTAALADVERGPTTEAIAQAKNNITIRELDLAQQRDSLETKYEIHAPFDGIVSTIDFKVGDNLVADDAKYVYIQNPDLVQLSISLDQIDVVKVKANQTVEVVFDALPKQTFVGMIEMVDPAPVESSGVVSYAAKITLDKGTTPIFSGMTATAQIITAEQKNVLVVPAAALSARKEKTFVRKMIDGKAQPTPIEIGVSDGKKTEVKSGLTEGDIIVISDATTRKANAGSSAGTNGATNQSQNQLGQIFRATGGGGGGGAGGSRPGQ